MITLVDTSVWIDHFRKGNAALSSILKEGAVLSHPFVIGELSCGNLADRERLLQLLRALPQVEEAENDDVLSFVELQALFGVGLGWIDVHLLASCRLSNCSLWTLDRALVRAAKRLDISWRPR